MININGRTFSGNNLCMINGKVIIDGVEQQVDEKIINVTVDGNIDTLDIGSANQVKITGNVKKIKTQTADVDIAGNVEGDVETQTGDVDVDGSVGGNVRTMTGDIKYRK